VARLAPGQTCGTGPSMDKLQVLARCCFRLRITWPVATFPRPIQYPRRGDGRKGAYRRRHAIA
jgi:hypothetical protein